MNRKNKSRRGRRSANVRRSRRLVLVWMGVLLAGVVGCAAWVGIRMFLSYTELSQAQTEASAVVAAVSADPAQAAEYESARLDALAARLDSASALTATRSGGSRRPSRSRATTCAPTGSQSTASPPRSVTVCAPLVPAFARMGAAISLTDGRVDLAQVAESAQELGRASSVLEESRKTLAGADGGAVVTPLADGVRKAGSMVDDLSHTVSALSTAAKVIPAALGADGEKRYGLLMNNNAELRTTGGIAGAISPVTATDGAIALGDQLVPDDLNPATAAAPAVTREEATLFGPTLSSYIQNVNATPDFSRTAAFASELWADARGEKLDGVVSVDTVTLSRLLAVTGPVTAEGRELTSENATKVLLNDIYLQVTDRAEHDRFFGAVTRAVFDKLLHGGASALGMAKALDAAAEEGRISIWFADPALQSAIAGTNLAGPTARLSDDGAPVGVFLIDGTAGKMDYYLDGSLAASCTNGGKSGVSVTTTLRSTAPAEIANAPWYVTGAGQSTTSVGSIRTMLQFASTDSLRPERVTVDGKPVTLKWATIDGRNVAVAVVDLAPGATATVGADFALLPAKSVTLDRIVGTPTATAFATKVDAGRCG
ncbi:penicillin binding protein transpeptidase domain-containing protein [Leifsonia xyli subsp. cynodontis DSM 46306]|uniref:DUF4012 domain-containing protein n=2 Tax=Leifsonia xyli TaxID=1575 RepID=U3P393_LEIXC|nr:penicillin binding protein transpeptidase domain-containing protein [Leifsonia xyli subsp. cynodontis DSM 46306]